MTTHDQPLPEVLGYKLAYDYSRFKGSGENRDVVSLPQTLAADMPNDGAAHVGGTLAWARQVDVLASSDGFDVSARLAQQLRDAGLELETVPLLIHEYDRGVQRLIFDEVSRSDEFERIVPSQLTQIDRIRTHSTRVPRGTPERTVLKASNDVAPVFLLRGDYRVGWTASHLIERAAGVRSLEPSLFSHRAKQTRLMKAIELGTPEDVEAELPSADLEASDLHGWTALHWAAERGAPGICRLLFCRGANPNPESNRRVLPIHVAAYFGHAHLVDLMRGHGGSTTATDSNGRTALHWAAAGGREESTKRLLDTFDLEQTMTPIRTALGQKQYKILEILLKERPPHSDELAHLLERSFKGRMGGALPLLNAGAKLATLPTDIHPAARAAAAGEIEVLERALTAGCHPDACVVMTSLNMLTRADTASLLASASVIQRLLLAGADPDAQAPDGLTPRVRLRDRIAALEKDGVPDETTGPLRELLGEMGAVGAR